jgi:hypothetical protein
VVAVQPVEDALKVVDLPAWIERAQARRRDATPARADPRVDAPTCRPSISSAAPSGEVGNRFGDFVWRAEEEVVDPEMEAAGGPAKGEHRGGVVMDDESDLLPEAKRHQVDEALGHCHALLARRDSGVEVDRDLSASPHGRGS